MSDPTTALRAAWKAWRLRNSDGTHSFGDEHMTEPSRRIQAPPSFTLVETNLSSVFTDPDDDDARATRHTHDWSVEEP